ncbi:MAG: UDP-N-acetylmuramate:L-alanyl-gamma-D-glutamyl-meso-diaminopimelate ligase [Nitrospiria bacterium]
MNKSERIHMIAVCGTGMAALAGLLKKRGHHVSGSDHAVYPPMSTLLEAEGIVCKQGFDPSHIDPGADRVIIGNAVSRDNPEVVETLRRKLPYLSMASALERFFLEGKQSLVVAGTHGKTTTSSLLASVLDTAGYDPGFLIGGWIKNFDSNHRVGEGPFFVVEGDEYDTAFFDKGPKFLHYRPHHAILTSIEFDHADIFPDLSIILGHFKNFIGLIPPKGRLLAAAGSPEIESVIRNLSCRVERYASALDASNQKDACDWWADSVKVVDRRLQFEVWYRQKNLGCIESPLFGRHNLKNALAVIALSHHLGLTWDQIRKGLRTFQGVKRRQEIVGIARDILVIDDFAHHPTAISETIAALRLQYPSRRLWVVFEPRSATSRRNVFQEAFIEAFQTADGIVVADLHAPDQIPSDQRLDPGKLVADLKTRAKTAFFIPKPDAIVDALSQRLLPGDIVCIMSCGGFGGIHQKLLSQLKNTPTADQPTMPN